MGSLAETWFGEGKTEGLAEGLTQGKAELLERQLAYRFGPLSEDVRARLAQATTEELGGFAESVLDAGSLSGVLTDGSGGKRPGRRFAPCRARARSQTGAEVPAGERKFIRRSSRNARQRAAENELEAVAREWFDEGKAEGVAQGKAAGKAELLEQQLARRFGPLSEVERAWVAQATAKELDGFAEVVLDAESVNFVLTNSSGRRHPGR